MVLQLAAANGPSQAAEPIKLDPRVEAAERQRIAAVARAMPSTVSIFVPGGGGGGSGVLITPDGYALTNFHVSSPAGNYMRCGLSDGRIYDAVIIGVDPVGDLALIRLLGRNDFPAAEFADSLKARTGQWCMVIGNPFLLNTNLNLLYRGAFSAVSVVTNIPVARYSNMRTAFKPMPRSTPATQAARCMTPMGDCSYRRSRFVREARPSQCRCRLCDLDQPSPQFSW